MVWYKSVLFLLLTLKEVYQLNTECIKSGKSCKFDGSFCCNKIDSCAWNGTDSGFVCMRPVYLSTTCWKNSDCWKTRKCSENGTCVCGFDYVPTENNYECKDKRMNVVGEVARFWDFICSPSPNGTICEIPASNGLAESKLMYGEKCNSIQDCAKYNLSLTCIDGECKCKLGELFAYKELKCKSTENSGLGRPCNESNKCTAENSYCDYFEICRCKRYHYFKDGGCVFDTNYECPENFYFNTDKNKCTHYTRDIGGLCFNDEGCAKLPRSSYKYGFCRCLSTYATAYNRSCIVTIGEVCYQPQDCDVENSTCVNSYCRCVEGTYASENNMHCLPLASTVGLTDEKKP